jgi:hypothetical protein
MLSALEAIAKAKEHFSINEMFFFSSIVLYLIQINSSLFYIVH